MAGEGNWPREERRGEGRRREGKKEGGGGYGYLVCLIMKAIFSVVTSCAAMIRSPSFSRSVESRTTMNSPFRKAEMVASMLSKCSFGSPLGSICRRYCGNTGNGASCWYVECWCGGRVWVGWWRCFLFDRWTEKKNPWSFNESGSETRQVGKEGELLLRKKAQSIRMVEKIYIMMMSKPRYRRLERAPGQTDKIFSVSVNLANAWLSILQHDKPT